MIDINLIREKPEYVKEMSARKGVDIDIKKIVETDEAYRTLLRKTEEMRAKKNAASEEIVRAKSDKERKKIIEEMRKIDAEHDAREHLLAEKKEKLDRLLRQIPNLPSLDTPLGGEEANVVMREEGKKRVFDFPPMRYTELAEKLDIIDTERAAKVSGSRFGYLKGGAALLEFALVQYALASLCKEGFTPLVPPVLIKPEMMSAMGYVERGGEEIYRIEKDDLYLVGTSEQAVGPMHANEVFAERELPRRYVAFSTCFRREAGSYGKDTKGILRVHQFDKVEMFSFVKPEDSKNEHDFLLALEERLMKGLGIPYRVVRIAAGDLGDPAASKYDIEAWLPGQGEYRETHSTSNTTDFQARRLNIRYRSNVSAQVSGVRYVHMLNGTAFAIGRTLIAILENYQQKDGNIEIPDVLQKYTGFSKIQKAPQ